MDQVEAILGISWEDFVAFWDHLEAMFGNLGTILGWSWGLLGMPWGNLAKDAKRSNKACLIEMQKSLPPYACAAKTLPSKSKTLSSIDITNLVEMPKSLSHYACAAKTPAWHHTSAKRLIGANDD